DFHVHTDFSDGADPPERVVERAAGLGFSFLAVSDHDTVGGLRPARSRAEALGLRLVSAVEVSATAEGSDIHLLGYLVDEENGEFVSALEGVVARRRGRVRRMIEKLQRLGVPADAEAFFARFPRGWAGRLNLAHYLVEEGLVPSVEAVFGRYLGAGRPAYEPVDALTTAEAIQIIHKAGGVAVLAHPGRNGADALIPRLVEEGLSGIEAYHSSHSPAAAESYRKIADARGLVVTGGSDCHGKDASDPLLGTVRMPVGMLEALEARAGGPRRSGGSGPGGFKGAKGG
ncbi:MAG: PHP domain-containing protein, partial [Nitrospinota bacterium]